MSLDVLSLAQTKKDKEERGGRGDIPISYSTIRFYVSHQILAQTQAFEKTKP